jgi:hypothetical protein
MAPLQSNDTRVVSIGTVGEIVSPVTEALRRGSERESTRTSRRSSVTLADVGLNRLARLLAGIQGVIALLFLALTPHSGLTVDWPTATVYVLGDGVLVLLWIYLWRVPGRQREWIMAETVLAFALTLILSHLLAPSQYLAVTTNRALIDPWLASGDALLHVNVGLLAAWTTAHPTVDTVFRLAYFSLLPQFALIVPILGIFLRDRDALWEYVFHFHFCAIVTVLAVAVFPAAHAFQYYGFQSTLDQTRLIAHFNGIRAGSFHLIQFNNLEGLICMPSFHAAGAMMVLWALRYHPKVFWPAAVLNVLLVAATVMTGAHYVVDLLGTAVLFAVSLAIWHTQGRYLSGVLQESDRSVRVDASLRLE